MQHVRLLSSLLALIILTGCASIPPQEPVTFNNSLASPSSIIAISISEIPEAKIVYPGADCLLCLTAAGVANGKLSRQVANLNVNDLEPLGEQLISKLESAGHNLLLIDETTLKNRVRKLKKITGALPNQARKDYSPLKEELKATHLLVLDIEYVGFQRDYSSYVPASEPYAIVKGVGYIIDLSTNIYEWYLPIMQRHSPGQDWKDPPQFPRVINAYYQAIESTKDEVLSSIGTQKIAEE